MKNERTSIQTMICAFLDYALITIGKYCIEPIIIGKYRSFIKFITTCGKIPF